MQRYFVTSNNNEIIFSTDDIFHISVVMRNKINDLIEIVLDSNVYLAKIISFKPFKVEIVSKIEENHELNGFIRLILCSLRGDKNEFVIQKAVELGVKEIIIVESTRSVSKILDKKDSKLDFNKLVEYLGGKDNIIDSEVNLSRFIVTLKNINLVDKDAIMSLGAKGMVEVDNQLKIILGSSSGQLKKYIQDMK